MRRITGWLTTLITMVMLLANPLAGIYAQAADGDGDGSGGDKSNPLAIESSNPADGASAVSSLEYIKIVFTKNIAYMTIRDSNIKCFSLWSGGQKIPAEIIIADDQIEREKRNDVLVKPLQPLKAGAAYTVEIAPELQSKSGVFLGQKATITFTMAGAGPLAPTATAGSTAPVSAPASGVNPAEIAQTTSAANPESGMTPAGVTESPPETSAADKNEADSEATPNHWPWLTLGAAAAVLAVWFYRRSRRQ